MNSPNTEKIGLQTMEMDLSKHMGFFCTSMHTGICCLYRLLCLLWNNIDERCLVGTQCLHSSFTVNCE